MKTLALTMGLLLTVPAFASQEIYEALNVMAKTQSSSRLELIEVKDAGGLFCTKTTHQADGVSIKCEVDFSMVDSSVLYESLSVEEVALSAPRTQLVFEKKVGHLSCVKTSDVSHGVTHVCKLAL